LKDIDITEFTGVIERVMEEINKRKEGNEG
jgi:hypothetical protein